MYIEKHQKIYTKKCAENAKRSWIIPQYLTLHWSGKLLPKPEDRYQLEEQVVVAIIHQTEMKTLGVPSNQPSIKQALGSTIASKTLNLLKEWNCQRSLVAMTFKYWSYLYCMHFHTASNW